MSTQNIIVPGNLAADFRVNGTEILNDAILGGAGAPVANPPVIDKVWLWVNTITSKVSHYWDTVVMAWVATIDDDILTRYDFSGTAFPVLDTAEKIELYSMIGFRRTDLEDTIRWVWNATQSVWMEDQVQPITLGRNDTTTNPGNPIGLVNNNLTITTPGFGGIGDVYRFALVGATVVSRVSVPAGSTLTFDLEVANDGTQEATFDITYPSTRRAWGIQGMWQGPLNRTNLIIRYQAGPGISRPTVILHFRRYLD